MDLFFHIYEKVYSDGKSIKAVEGDIAFERQGERAGQFGAPRVTHDSPKHRFQSRKRRPCEKSRTQRFRREIIQDARAPVGQ